MNEELRDDFQPEDAGQAETVDEAHAMNSQADPSFHETRDEEMDRLRTAAASADKRVLMAQAEAENFRKRMRRDVEEQLRFAASPMVVDILEVRDNLLRALEAAKTSMDTGGLQDGVAMVAKQLDSALAKHSVEEIPALGEVFDPNCHEAISQIPSDDHPAGTVTHVAQSGFRMHDRVIRPSQVVVSSGPAAS